MLVTMLSRLQTGVLQEYFGNFEANMLAAPAGDPLAGDPLAGDPLAGDPLAGEPAAMTAQEKAAMDALNAEMAAAAAQSSAPGQSITSEEEDAAAFVSAPPCSKSKWFNLLVWFEIPATSERVFAGCKAGSR